MFFKFFKTIILYTFIPLSSVFSFLYLDPIDLDFFNFKKMEKLENQLEIITNQLNNLDIKANITIQEEWNNKEILKYILIFCGVGIVCIFFWNNFNGSDSIESAKILAEQASDNTKNVIDTVIGSSKNIMNIEKNLMVTSEKMTKILIEANRDSTKIINNSMHTLIKAVLEYQHQTLGFQLECILKKCNILLNYYQNNNVDVPKDIPWDKTLGRTLATGEIIETPNIPSQTNLNFKPFTKEDFPSEK